MDKKPCFLLTRHLFCRFAGAGLFVFLFFDIGHRSFGQSYFFLQNKLSLSADSSVTYSTFLNIQTTGRGVARVRFEDPYSREKRLIEINLIDSADSRGGLIRPDHYLVSEGEPLPIEGVGLDGFHFPRFVFKKSGDSAAYAPEAVFYKLADSRWRPSEMLVKQEKTNTQLLDETDLVSIFYNQTEDMYGFLTGERMVQGSRGSAPKRSEKIYLLMVANTRDSIVGVSARIDMMNVTSTLTRLAKDMNADIQIQKITDNDLGKKAVEVALSNLHPSPNDIVIFYYSGHGFRYSKDGSEFPRISLRLNRDVDLSKNNLGIEAIYKTLLKKKARVTIVIGDCCNNDLGDEPRQGPSVVMSKAPGDYKPQLNLYLCKQLFFPEKPVSILIGSASPNQLAVGNPTIGGYFTHSFTAELLDVLYGFGRNVSWRGLIARTKKSASWLSLGAECDPPARCVQSARVEITPKLED